MLWKCKIPGEQAVKTDEPLTLLILTEGTSLRTMILEGSLQRFCKEIDLSSASVAISSAVTLMPETAKDLDDVVMPQELTEVEAPEHELWLHVVLNISVLAGARAWAADVSYRALKTEAVLNNITFSDTNFAKIALNKKCCALTKALGHSLTDPTALDGKIVMVIEQKVAIYRVDFEKLRNDLAILRSEQVQAFAQVQAAADVASHRCFSPLAVIFLTTYVPAFVAAAKDRAHRLRIISSILRAAQNEEQFDSSWWTVRKVDSKLKKLARRQAAHQ